jgi:hypothetical protein
MPKKIDTKKEVEEKVDPKKSEFEDITLKCIDCSANFVFSAKEQEYYRDRNLATPKRCVKCRLIRRSKINQTVRIDG